MEQLFLLVTKQLSGVALRRSVSVWLMNLTELNTMTAETLCHKPALS
jgi:hypothetical protein